MSKVNATLSEPAQTGRSRKNVKWTIVILAGLILIGFVLVILMNLRMNRVPANLDLSTTLTSAAGLYRVSYTPEQNILTNQIHTWKIHVETLDGEPVENAEITVDGDMPQHGHGLPTRPQVTQYLGNGDYKLEGLKFHMPGWWIVELEIKDGGKTDQITFNLLLEK